MISVKRPLILAASAALALMFSIVSANTLAATTTMRFPIVQTVFACDANGGMGEAVPMSGTALLVENLTMDSNGGFHAKFHLQAQNVTGVGQISGDLYRLNGQNMSRVNIGADGLPFSFTAKTTFNVIGPGLNFLVHENVHVTINANGETTAEVENEFFGCQ